MKKINSQEMKKIELDILIYVADFCDKHNLCYYLSYGTLIGAIRHKGFIPWDDDIDIVMPREDYDNLIKIFNLENADSPYFASIPGQANHSFLKIGDKRTIKHEIEYKYERCKGAIDIDIFPLDGVPEDESLYEKWFDKLNKLYTIYFYRKANKKIFSFKQRLKFFIKSALCGILLTTDNQILKRAEKLHKKYPLNMSKYVGVIESMWNSKKNKVLKKYYEDRVQVEFEGHKFYAPKAYHEILTNIYGDYLKLPPIDKQVAEHRSDAFWIEEM